MEEKLSFIRRQTITDHDGFEHTNALMNWIKRGNFYR